MSYGGPWLQRKVWSRCKFQRQNKIMRRYLQRRELKRAQTCAGTIRVVVR